ncbi:MAG: hypothetical protein CVU11_04395 [Bacteroidetes bacterium HGW-Bacteroidetes-6]|jgi:hypothetical protein|nr:MAG: hypothetical protein CVU11_04395 [Bacteroidetes bacterium HGW-Bacteroidetes-6]
MRTFLTVLLLFPIYLWAQLSNKNLTSANDSQQSYQNSSENTESSPAHFFDKAENLKLRQISPEQKNMILGDTLYILNDTLISGSWSFAGTLVAYDTGKVLIQNATVILPGDLVVYGNDARIDIVNSTVYQPQQYFYQRSVVAVGHGVFRAENSTLNYNNLSHNMVIGENGLVELIDVTTIGFRTCGVSAHGTININGINEAGEFVITDSADINIRNASTVLLWHQFPDGSSLTHTFPDGDTLIAYNFNSSTPGVLGIGYDIDIDSCTHVMWGLMPEPNTNIDISNSSIRAIGLWFTGSDSLDVSGLVDQSTYTNQTMNISDRTLTLQNTTVQTWSLYSFDTVFVDVHSCIVGEIGSFGYSQVFTSSTMIDGSGGYFFANDNSICLAGFSTTTSAVRSQRDGIMIYANGSILNGAVEALNESILIVVQSSLPQDPVYRDNACVWFAMIDGPYNAYYGQNYPISGSAWIDKDPASPKMDFDHYQLFYSTDQGVSWIAIDTPRTIEKHHAWLGDFNTALLPSEGSCLLKLSLTDNQTIPFTMDAVVALNVLPAYLGLSDENTTLKLYPNPVTTQITIESDLQFEDFRIFNTKGQLVKSGLVNENNTVDVENLPNGLYFLSLDGEKQFRGRFLKE